MTSYNNLDILVCPDCKNKLKAISTAPVLFLYCDICKIIFPEKEGIFILLPKYARNHELEMPLVKKIEEKISSSQDNNLMSILNNTLNLLKSLGAKRSWEWEDEVYWNRRYQESMEGRIQTNWNFRLWQREFLLKNILKELDNFDSKIILDVGSGEGQNFRYLLSKHSSVDTMYISVDISFNALLLNRLKNPHRNSMYILSCAGSLPVRKESVDVLCYFGILHHVKENVSTLTKDIDSVKRGGYIMLHEALKRPAVLRRILKNEEESHHEGRIVEKDLFAEIKSSNNLTVIAIRKMNTIIMSGFLRFFQKHISKNKGLCMAMIDFDRFFMSFLRYLCPYFKPAEVLLLLKKS